MDGSSSSETSPAESQAPRFGYLIRMYPQLSETFIANEILRLERLGLPITVYSTRLPEEKVEHQVVRLVQSPITYLTEPGLRHAHGLMDAVKAMRAAEPERF